MNREVHVRVWERAEVKFLRATRQTTTLRQTLLCFVDKSDLLNPGGLYFDTVRAQVLSSCSFGTCKEIREIDEIFVLHRIDDFRHLRVVAPARIVLVGA